VEDRPNDAGRALAEALDVGRVDVCMSGELLESEPSEGRFPDTGGAVN